MENITMDTEQLIGCLYSLTWSGQLYPEQTKAVKNAINLIDSKEGTNYEMLPGEIARHLIRIKKFEVKTTYKFRLTAEQVQAIDRAVQGLLQYEDNINDAEKGRYD